MPGASLLHLMAQKVLKVFVYLAILLATVVNSQSDPSSRRRDVKAVSLAVSGFDANTQLFFQDASGKLRFRHSVAGEWQGEPLVIEVTVDPKPETPLAAVSWEDSGRTNIRLYYLSTNNDIIEVVVDCASGNDCTSQYGYGFQVDVMPTSGLAAAYFSTSKDNWGLRVYYLNRRSMISELAWDFGTGWNSGSVIGGQAHAKSSMAVSVEPGKVNLQVYYFTVDGLLSQISWKDQWTSGAVIRKDLPPELHPTLAAVAKPSSRRLYYIRESKHVNELLFEGGMWTSQPTSLDIFLEADAAGGPVAAVTWASGVKVYYLSGGSITEVATDPSGRWPTSSNTSTNISTSGDGSMMTRSDGESLSLADKIGIAIGVVGAVAGIVGAWCTYLTLRKKSGRAGGDNESVRSLLGPDK